MMAGVAVVGILAAIVAAGTLFSAWVIRNSPPGPADVSFLDLMDGATGHETPDKGTSHEGP